MGEHSTNKKGLTGIVVTVVSGILIAIATNPDVIKRFTDASIEVLTGKKEHERHPQETLPKLVVDAKSLTGDTYPHPENEQPAELEYKAHGKWTAIPTDVPQPNIPKGEKDADGYTDTNFSANPDKPCPNSNTGALVVVAEDSECLSDGKTGSFTAQPGHEYRFIMNDNRQLYGDNEGIIKVTLHKKK